MATQRAPKQWCLSKTENVTSFENWRQNIQYTLSLDPNFAPFLVQGVQWHKKTKDSPHRGFTNDNETVPQNKRRTREQKVNMLELMLGQIANYCPVISRNTIVKNSISIDSIWQSIRLHYGFQSTGAHFIDLANIKFEPNERPEDLYQRVNAFIEDNLLCKDSGIKHHDCDISEDEELTPSLENIIVLTWLQLIHQDLPKLVKQRYGTELRSRTLASIKPEISQAMDSLLEELRTSEDAKAMRTAVFQPRQRQFKNKSKSVKSCPLCKASGRTDSHFLSTCTYLPNSDKQFMLKARQVTGTEQESEDELDTEHHSIGRVQVRQSPYIDAFFEHHTVRLTIDSGATGNMIRASSAYNMNAKITSSSQSAHQADGSSPLKVVGETRMVFNRDGHDLYFEGLVVENLDTDILAGIPFMEKNDISIRPAKHHVLVRDIVYTYGSIATSQDRHIIRRAHVLLAPTQNVTVWPGEYLEAQLPENMADGPFAIEPHLHKSTTWPRPTVLDSVSGKIRIPNLSSEPQTVKRNEHFCNVRSTFIPESVTDQLSTKQTPNTDNHKTPHSSQVTLDPDNMLTQEDKRLFGETLTKFDDVFSPHFSGYNGAVGPFQAKVNMGPVQPPQRKGRLPQYSRNHLQELQSKFDELEQLGVFKRPEDINVNVEYVNPSFLVKKQNGSFRLVTAFADVGRYSKPQPSLMPDIDSTLRQIAQWKFIITTDLTKSFYQIPLSSDSLKYCGVVTPFKGVRVYVRCAMGMPGSETALEELTCRVFGDLVEEGFIAKLADDLYCGGNTIEELHRNWQRVLEALQKCNLNLSASKTVIAPKTAMILGWVWSMGTLRASKHRIATLSSCPPPKNITGLRSFIGAYKVLTRVIKDSASILAPLEDALAGHDSKDIIVWSDSLLSAFTKAQTSLGTNKSITLPRPTDQLWIVTDGAVKHKGLGATLYVARDTSLLLAGFFSAKLHKNQINWLPCEVEALSIAAATKHFSPFLIQSTTCGCVLTDSKPCVQAFEKLCRGEFSASPRVSTFLSTASRYQVSIRHVAGVSILPSDFASRNAPVCDEPLCQICTFVNLTENSVVRHISTQDILNGSSKLPFTTRSSWIAIQSECSDLRRTHAHLKQGTRPSKKLTNIKDVKRYLNVASVAKDGLLIVKRNIPFQPTHECIIVPRTVVDGLITSLHIKLDHPSCHQLKTVLHRYFYALDLDRSIEKATTGCHQCASLLKVPNVIHEQSTSDPPEIIGSAFAADVMRRERQYILVLREHITSYTSAVLIESEKHNILRDALLQLCIEMRPLDGPSAVIRTDSAPGFVALLNDKLLEQHRISIEVGRVKNINKNPIAERAIQELEDEILRQDPTCRAVLPLTLSLAVARMNTRIRNRGLSSREMWTQRDQFTNSQLPIDDQKLIIQQHEQKVANHSHSEKSKTPSGKISDSIDVAVGDLIYLHSDRNKHSARDRYLVVAVEKPWCNIRKFTGSQLRRTSYRVKYSACYKVPNCLPTTPIGHNTLTSSQSDNELDDPELLDTISVNDETATHQLVTPPPPQPPDIPFAISDPPAARAENDLSIIPDNTQLSDNAITRPKRQHRLPSKFKDFEM